MPAGRPGRGRRPRVRGSPGCSAGCGGGSSPPALLSAVTLAAGIGLISMAGLPDLAVGARRHHRDADPRHRRRPVLRRGPGRRAATSSATSGHLGHVPDPHPRPGLVLPRHRAARPGGAGRRALRRPAHPHRRRRRDAPGPAAAGAGAADRRGRSPVALGAVVLGALDPVLAVGARRVPGAERRGAAARHPPLGRRSPARSPPSRRSPTPRASRGSPPSPTSSPTGARTSSSTARPS